MGRQYGETEISKYNKDKLKREKMTPAEMIRFLEGEAKYRTFGGELRKRVSSQGEEEELIKRLCAMTGRTYDTTRKNLSNWLNNKNEPHRKNLFQLCFALGLDEEEADDLISCTDEAGIHYRNPEELIYAFCLRTGRTWSDVVRLREELLPLYEQAAKEKNTAEQPVPYTRTIERDFAEQVHTEEDLKHFLLTRATTLGRNHETAYREFMQMLDYLQLPVKEGRKDDYYDYLKGQGKKRTEEEQQQWEFYKKESEKYSVQQVVETYMRMFVPGGEGKGKGKKNAPVPKRDYTQLQRIIQKNWPTADSLEKMKNRSCDVSRKVMLLLFLLTEEFEMQTPDEASHEDDESVFLGLLEQASPAELMEARLVQINLFLENYGMNQLDPARPFDLLVLYALQAEYSQDEDISDRMARVTESLFGEEKKEQSPAKTLPE